MISGDFDGDRQLDLAIRIRSTADEHVTLVIVQGSGRAILLDSLEGAPSDLDAFVVLRALPAKEVAHLSRSGGQHGDGIEMVKPESSSGVIYYDGSRYRWSWTSD